MIKNYGIPSGDSLKQIDEAKKYYDFKGLILLAFLSSCLFITGGILLPKSVFTFILFILAIISVVLPVVMLYVLIDADTIKPDYSYADFRYAPKYSPKGLIYEAYKRSTYKQVNWCENLHSNYHRFIELGLEDKYTEMCVDYLKLVNMGQSAMLVGNHGVEDKVNRSIKELAKYAEKLLKESVNNSYSKLESSLLYKYNSDDLLEEAIESLEKKPEIINA